MRLGLNRITIVDRSTSDPRKGGRLFLKTMSTLGKRALPPPLDGVGARLMLNLCEAGVSNQRAGELCSETGSWSYSISTVKRIKRHANDNAGAIREPAQGQASRRRARRGARARRPCAGWPCSPFPSS